MEERYLCPVCEHELRGKRYCPECRRFVREPLVYKGGALPNEYKEYGRQISVYSAPASGSSGTKAPKHRSDVDTNTRFPDNCGTKKHVYGIPNVDPHTAEQKKKKQAARRVRILVIIFVIIGILIAFAEPLIHLVGGLADSSEDGDNYSEYAMEEEDDEVDEAAIMAAGEPCSGYYHYDMDGQEYTDRILDYCGEVFGGETITISDPSVYNWKSGDYTYYESRVYIDIGENGTYIGVLSDSVTGEVMEVSMSSENTETTMQLLLLAGCAFEPEEDRNVLWEEIQSCFSEVKGDYVFINWRSSDLYISLDDTGCYASLGCLPEFDKYQ